LTPHEEWKRDKVKRGGGNLRRHVQTNWQVLEDAEFSPVYDIQRPGDFGKIGGMNAIWKLPTAGALNG
jgi:hypothetical protein